MYSLRYSQRLKLHIRNNGSTRVLSLFNVSGLQHVIFWSSFICKNAQKRCLLGLYSTNTHICALEFQIFPSFADFLLRFFIQLFSPVRHAPPCMFVLSHTKEKWYYVLIKGLWGFLLQNPPPPTLLYWYIARFLLHTLSQTATDTIRYFFHETLHQTFKYSVMQYRYFSQ